MVLFPRSVKPNFLDVFQEPYRTTSEVLSLGLYFEDTQYKHPHMGFFKKVSDIWGEALVVGQSAGTAEDTGQWQGIGLAAIQEWGKSINTFGMSLKETFFL